MEQNAEMVLMYIKMVIDLKESGEMMKKMDTGKCFLIVEILIMGSF